jgi:AcrR family transcriptional regulator
MGIPERREREKEEVRRKILGAARDLFTSEGYDKVTMRRIADAIEYSPTTIYYHFKDKDDVVRCLCEQHFGGLLGAMAKRQAPADPVEHIRQLGRAYARYGLDHPNEYRFMFLTPHAHQPLDASDPGFQSFGLLRSAVARAIESGRFRSVNADTAAQVLWSSLHGAVALSITYRPEDLPNGLLGPKLIHEVIESGIRAFLANPEG